MTERHVEVESDDSRVEVDDALETDTDSTFGDTASSTRSLSSSVMQYRHENGRRYHAFREGTYFFPNDEVEQDRLDVIHHMTDLVQCGKLFLAPIPPNPQRILDLGTGTGIWAIDMGDMFPSAEVIGNDLSPIQPNMVPPNVIFEVDDIEDDWMHKRPFDFIHARYLATAIANWPRLCGQIFNNLKPGGWVELCDYDFKYHSDDGTLTSDLAMVRNDDMVLDASRRMGREPCPGPRLKGWLEDAGFANVTEKRYKLPIGPWPKDRTLKEVGMWNQMQFLQGVEAWSMSLLTQVYGWTATEVKVEVARVRSDAQNMNIHAWYMMHVVYGQKPEKS